LLKDVSENCTKSVDMSDFFLNETQAQLQLAMFGFSEEFQERTNKKVRNAFLGIESEYLKTFADEAYHEILKSSGPLSEVIQSSKDMEQFIGNILIFAFAGHDTTGHTLSWLLYELCKHPKYKKELINEIDNYWLNNREESYESFNQLPFMTKCITESLRLWPALANGTYRELESDENIVGLNGGKVTVPKGTYCQIMNWTRHRNPDLWGVDVNMFNPHRDFKDEEIWDHKGFGTTHVSSERFSPFTYGPRHCIGKNFSQMEMRLILLNLFKDCDFELDSKQKETINDPKYMGINTFTMGPQSVHGDILGMHCHVIPRKSKL
jgi:cytochrome P450